MRKRYTRKYRHWSPRWKWKLQDQRVIEEFEREWEGGFPRVLRRRGQEERPGQALSPDDRASGGER